VFRATPAEDISHAAFSPNKSKKMGASLRGTQVRFSGGGGVLANEGGQEAQARGEEPTTEGHGLGAKGRGALIASKQKAGRYMQLANQRPQHRRNGATQAQ